MGAWGTKLYDNDLTCDIRDTYIDMLENSEDYNLAYTQILAEYADDCTDECEKAMLTYVLADVQHDYGCVIQSVLENAMNYIAVGGGKEIFETPKQVEKWLKTLDRLKEKLSSQPPERKRKPRSKRIDAAWNIGDCFAYTMHSKYARESGMYGKIIIIQKVGNSEWTDGLIVSRVQFFRQIFDAMPSLADLADSAVLPLESPDIFINGTRPYNWLVTMNALILPDRSRCSEKYLSYLGNTDDKFGYPPANPFASAWFWSDIEPCVISMLQSWDKYDYSFENSEMAVLGKKRH